MFESFGAHKFKGENISMLNDSFNEKFPRRRVGDFFVWKFRRDGVE